MITPDSEACDSRTEESVLDHVTDGRVSIEPNGREYLVMVNGAPFLALSREQAEAIARRRGRPVRGR